MVVLENRADAPLAAALREEGVPVLLDVALDARRENPAIRVVIRVFDEDLARKVREGFGSEALSASGLAAPALATLTVAGLRDRFGALTLSLERGGAVRPHPPGDTRVAEGDRLLVQALWPDYRRLREHLGEGDAPRGP